MLCTVLNTAFSMPRPRVLTGLSNLQKTAKPVDLFLTRIKWFGVASLRLALDITKLTGI